MGTSRRRPRANYSFVHCDATTVQDVRLVLAGTQSSVALLPREIRS
jgi:hypothetical protein